MAIAFVNCDLRFDPIRGALFGACDCVTTFGECYRQRYGILLHTS